MPEPTSHRRTLPGEWVIHTADPRMTVSTSAAGSLPRFVRVKPGEYPSILPALAIRSAAASFAQPAWNSVVRTPAAAGQSPGSDPYGSPTPPHADAAEPASAAPMRLDRPLRDALHRRAPALEFQPQYDLKTGRGCGVEALQRLVLSTRDTIPPSVLMPPAGKAGLIGSLGAWALLSACKAVSTWCNRRPQRTTLSVNVSTLHINREFCTVIGQALKQSGFPANQLELEIPESALITNPERTISYMKEWKQLGVRIAMDDFGAGYSSLNQLSRLPVDRLKLDRSLVAMLTRGPKHVAVVRSIIALGAALKIDVIAVGVETEEQFQILTDLGCPRVQGNLLGRPMPAFNAQVALQKTWGYRPKPLGYPRSPAILPPRSVDSVTGLCR